MDKVKLVFEEGLILNYDVVLGTMDVRIINNLLTEFLFNDLEKFAV